MQKTFETPEAISLYVELDLGSVTVLCDDVAETAVSVDGRDADDVVVEQRGDQIQVVAPKNRGGLFDSDRGLAVHVRLPHGSALATKLASAPVTVTGRLGEARIRTGSGDVRVELLDGDGSAETGSGDIVIAETRGGLIAKSGSGRIEIGRADGPVSASTGSGDVVVGVASAAVSAKSGSGNVRVADAQADVSLKTATGDLVVGSIRRGQVEAKNATGDIRVGVVAGVPVWTDIKTVTGSVSSTLEGAGQPDEGQEYVELRAKTVSGDIYLEQK